MAKKQKGKQKEVEQTTPGPPPPPPPPPPGRGPVVHVEDENEDVGGLIGPEDYGSWGGLTDVPEDPEGEASESDPWRIKSKEHVSNTGGWKDGGGGGGGWGTNTQEPISIAGGWQDGGSKAQNTHSAAATGRNQANEKKGVAAKGGGNKSAQGEGKRGGGGHESSNSGWVAALGADDGGWPAPGDDDGGWGIAGTGGDWGNGGSEDLGVGGEEWESEEDESGWEHTWAMPSPPRPPPQLAKSGWTTWGEEAKRLPKVTITAAAPEAAVGTRVVLSPQQRSEILKSLLNQPTQNVQQVSFQDYVKRGDPYQQYHAQQQEQQKHQQHLLQQKEQQRQRQYHAQQQEQQKHIAQQQEQLRRQQLHTQQQEQLRRQQHHTQQKERQKHEQQQQANRQQQNQPKQKQQQNQQPQQQQQQGGKKQKKKKQQEQEQQEQRQSQEYDPWSDAWDIPEEEEEHQEIDDGWNRRVRFLADVAGDNTYDSNQFGSVYNSPGLIRKAHDGQGTPRHRHNPSGPTYNMPSKTLAHAYRGTTTALHAGAVRNGMTDYADVRFIESKGKALAPVHRAFFGKERLAKDRIHWMFPSDKDDRVASLLRWIQDVSYNLGGFGLHKFLQTRERGALIANADYRPSKNPNEAAFDWLTFDELQPTMDRILQESVAFYNPAVQVIVFVCLPSKSGNSMAMWRRKVNVPNNLRLTYQEEIMLALAALRHEKDYVVHVDELPEKEVKLPPPKKHKWWHIRW